jgi:hypothetical protein
MVSVAFQVVLRTLNDAKSAFTAFHFEKGLFDPLLRFSVLEMMQTMCLCSVFRTSPRVCQFRHPQVQDADQSA